MKAAIALLSDFHVQNVVHRMVYEIHQHTGIKFFGSLLPAHVSLKQPFTFEDMDSLEEWFESFSGEIRPFRIDLERIYYEEWDRSAIVGFEVLETPTLRALHDRINIQLKNIVQDSFAPHDGDEYRFHLTVSWEAWKQETPSNSFMIPCRRNRSIYPLWRIALHCSSMPMGPSKQDRLFAIKYCRSQENEYVWINSLSIRPVQNSPGGRGVFCFSTLRLRLFQRRQACSFSSLYSSLLCQLLFFPWGSKVFSHPKN